MKKTLLFLSMFMFVLAGALYAQDEEITGEKVTEHEGWDKGMGWKPEMRFGDPAIELHYGIVKPGFHEDAFSGDITSTFSGEIRLGNVRLTQMSKNVVKYRFPYLFIGRISDDFGELDLKPSELIAENWKFGSSSSNGYGYNFGEHTNLIFYNTTGVVWSFLNFPNHKLIGLQGDDLTRVTDFGDEVMRFGDTYDVGIRFYPIKILAVNVGYEGTMVFPRHLFWKWAVSEIIEGAASGLIDNFARKVFEATPEALPVVAVVLKGAVNYAMFELRKGDMNWPFETAAPFTFETFKVGLNFTF